MAILNAKNPIPAIAMDDAAIIEETPNDINVLDNIAIPRAVPWANLAAPIKRIK